MGASDRAEVIGTVVASIKDFIILECSDFFFFENIWNVRIDDGRCDACGISRL